VQESVYDKFLALLEPAVGRSGSRIRRADRRDGPADLRGAPRHVASYVDGADVAFPGSSPDGDGWWFPPTVLLAGSTADRHWREEVFGPVLSVLPFRDEEDGGPAGQRHRVRPLRLGSGPATWAGRCASPGAVETGNLSVNSHSSVRYWTPFGGMKQSGLGRRTRPRRGAVVHRRQERVHLDGFLRGQLCSVCRIG
jgi:acyl-CoA reductase-like NAD-dependent aldehyde dehydrogenase